ncbi:MAG TPA: Fe2+-dependent dioxygenase [Thiothrix sp.]|nr:Fe2+-dependent dioxygenase [Thiothrix sp.]
MLLTIKKVLSRQQLMMIKKLLQNAEFVDGKLSAGKEAEAVKNNLELSQQSPLQQQLNTMVMNTLLQNKTYQQVAYPYRVATPFYVRYTKGMAYGFHVDDPVMGVMGQQYRTDVSTTLFLNEPVEYEGGELLIQTAFGEQRVKLNAGDAVVYPSSRLHRVTEVTQGERFAAVIWAQSIIKNAEQRELLHELSTARDSLLNTQPNNEQTRHVSNVYSNLVRMWSVF